MKTKAKSKTKDLILQVLDSHRVMAVATNRPDGWPQATLVGYANDGFLLYCFVARNSQKCANILRDGRVSIAIGSDAPLPGNIKGLSLAGRASIVTEESEFDHVSKLRLQRFPEYAVALDASASESATARVNPRPSPGSVLLLRIEPEIFSVLDYSKGFGHSDLITFSERDLDLHIESLRHRWDGNAP